MRLILTTALAVILPGLAIADELQPAAAASLDLGTVHGVAYYTVAPDGYRVVATLDGGADSPMRVTGTLLPGQALVVSVPHAVAAEPDSIRITRVGDRVQVQASGPAPHISQ